MGYHVYHSQLSCLTPVSGELKAVTHAANMQMHRARSGWLLKTKKTYIMKEGVNKKCININIKRSVMMMKKKTIISSLPARNDVYILNGRRGEVEVDDQWTPGSVVRVLRPRCGLVWLRRL